jgi:flagellar hook-associated protein 3 FlgL
MAITSVSRLGSANTYDMAVRNVSMRQSELSTLQSNMTSGKKIVQTADDPTGAAQAERALSRLSRIATDQRALASQRNAIGMAESTLGDVTNALQSFRDLVVSAGNGSYTAAERAAVAVQLSGLRDQIISLANSKDTNGLPLFSALGSAPKPFVGPNATAPDYTFNGLPGQTASSEVAIPFALDGQSAFMLDAVYTTTSSTNTSGGLQQTTTINITDPALASSGNNVITFNSFSGFDAGGVAAPAGSVYAIYSINGGAPQYTTTTTTMGVPHVISIPASTVSPGVTGVPGIDVTITGDIQPGDTITVSSPQSVFSVLDNAISNIGSAASSAATVTQSVDQTLTNIDISLERISAVRGQAGDLLNRADRISGIQEQRNIQLEADRSRAEDIDMVKAISDFQNKQTGFSAALQSYAQVQKLSLFEFIR